MNLLTSQTPFIGIIPTVIRQIVNRNHDLLLSYLIKTLPSNFSSREFGGGG